VRKGSVAVSAVAAAAIGTAGVLRQTLRRERAELARARDRAAELEVAGARAQAHTPLANGELRQRDLQRSALLRSVTHDLRTPLSAIRAVVSDLHDGVVFDEVTRQDLLETVLDEIDRLDRLVGNLLSMSRIEAGAMEPRATVVELDELLVHRVRSLDALLRHHQVVVAVDDDTPDVAADYAQIDQVVTNLLANAVAYTPEGTQIDISAMPSEGDAPLVRVAVADHGPGVDPDIAEVLFEPFVHGSVARSTGLGLAISRAIVEAHHGTIEVEPTAGGGATFVFTLPVASLRPTVPEPATAGSEE
jgi:two-component system sensor histidine kinase KdpD